eukprot:g17985.t1
MAKAKARSRTFKSLEECLAAAGRLEEEPDATTRSACTPDFELFLPLGLPRKGDWLAEHKETGQSFSTYHRRMKYPATPGKHTDTILLVPFGSFAEGVAQQFRPLLLDYCQAFFSGMMVECLPKPLRVGVFSFARHSPFFYEGLHASEVPSLKDGAGWLRECMRTMVHETCHMFGMLHCLLLALSYAPGDSSVLPRYQAIQRSMQNLLEEFRAQGVPDGEMEGLLSDLQWLEMLGEWKAMRRGFVLSPQSDQAALNSLLDRSAPGRQRLNPLNATAPELHVAAPPPEAEETIALSASEFPASSTVVFDTAMLKD